MKWVNFLFFVIFCTSCTFAGDQDTFYGESGFLLGAWHGMVSIGGLVVSIFSSKVGIYSFNNTGFFYNFFFLLCSIVFSWNIGIFASVISLIFLIL